MGKSADLLIQRIQSAIDQNKVKKADIMRSAGMSAAQLEAYLQRKSVPGLDVADRLARALGPSLSELIGTKEPKPTQSPLAETRASIIGDIVIALASIDEDKLRALREYARGFAEISRTNQGKNLAKNKGSL